MSAWKQLAQFFKREMRCYYNPFCDPLLICGAIVDIDRITDMDPEDWLADLGVKLPPVKTSNIVMPKLVELKEHKVDADAGVNYLGSLGVEVGVNKAKTASVSIMDAQRTVLPRARLQKAVGEALGAHINPDSSTLWSALTNEHNFIIYSHYQGVLSMEFAAEGDGQVDLGFTAGETVGLQGSIGWKATSSASVQTDSRVPFAFEVLQFKKDGRLVEPRGI